MIGPNVVWCGKAPVKIRHLLAVYFAVEKSRRQPASLGPSDTNTPTLDQVLARMEGNNNCLLSLCIDSHSHSIEQRIW